MDSTDKLIIERLFKLAQKQQQILVKLAQAVQEDVEGNKQYLSSAWVTAAVNSGVPGITPESIEYMPGGQDKNHPNVTIGSTYTITGIIPEQARMQFKDTFERQVAAQKPDLEGRVGMIFKDPPPKTASRVTNKK